MLERLIGREPLEVHQGAYDWSVHKMCRESCNWIRELRPNVHSDWLIGWFVGIHSLVEVQQRCENWTILKVEKMFGGDRRGESSFSLEKLTVK